MYDALMSHLSLVRISTAGSVDDGKSTLIGRMLHDSHAIYSDQFDAAQTAAQRLGEGMGFAFLLDGLKAEREQGITIDVAYRYFRTQKRAYILADTPGHEQYTRNMATGASTADIAIILLDARKGVMTQSKRHAFIASLLGVPHMIVAVNKMDLVDWSQNVFEKQVAAFTEFASRLDIPDLRFLPVSALLGDQVSKPSTHMPWFQGPTLLDMLDTIYVGSDRNMVDLRLPVQLVLRPHEAYRGYAGQVASGILRRGSCITVLPSRQKGTIKSIVFAGRDVEEAVPSMSITATLNDDLDISRGDVLVHEHNMPKSGRLFEAMLVWMDEPLNDKTVYLLKHLATTTKARIKLRYRIDVNTLHREESDLLKLNDIGRAVISTRDILHYDPYAKNRATGSFILIDKTTKRTVAGGMIIDREPEEQLPVIAESWHELHESSTAWNSAISPLERQQRCGGEAKTYWITGYVNSGKRALAYHLERQFWQKGTMVTVLDGGKLRHTLSSELGFSTKTPPNTCGEQQKSHES